MPLYLLLTLFTVWMAVEAVRRGQTQSWLWIILFFGPIGAAVYFFTDVHLYRNVKPWVRKARQGLRKLSA